MPSDFPNMNRKIPTYEEFLKNSNQHLGTDWHQVNSAPVCAGWYLCRYVGASNTFYMARAKGSWWWQYAEGHMVDINKPIEWCGPAFHIVNWNPDFVGPVNTHS